MKNNFTYLIILFLLLVLNSCSELKEVIHGSVPRTAQLPTTALCTNDAKTMEENFITFKDIDTNNELDNRVISFTYEQMMSNIEYLITEAKIRGIDKEKLGFRVYFGAKPEGNFNKGELKSIQLGEEGVYSTVFFVATLKGESEDASDYENVYEIPALDYGGSRRPPIKYKSNLPCPIHNIIH